MLVVRHVLITLESMQFIVRSFRTLDIDMTLLGMSFLIYLGELVV